MKTTGERSETEDQSNETESPLDDTSLREKAANEKFTDTAKENRQCPTGGSVHSGDGVKVEKAITINRPISEVYAFWRRMENLPASCLIYWPLFPSANPPRIGLRKLQKASSWNGMRGLLRKSATN